MTLLLSGSFHGGRRYLPAAHVLELIAESVIFAMGGSLGYADPRTISSKGAVRRTPTGEINDQPVYPYPPGAIQVITSSTIAITITSTSTIASTSTITSTSTSIMLSPSLSPSPLPSPAPWSELLEIGDILQRNYMNRTCAPFSTSAF